MLPQPMGVSETKRGSGEKDKPGKRRAKSKPGTSRMTGVESEILEPVREVREMWTLGR